MYICGCMHIFFMQMGAFCNHVLVLVYLGALSMPERTDLKSAYYFIESMYSILLSLSSIEEYLGCFQYFAISKMWHSEHSHI